MSNPINHQTAAVEFDDGTVTPATRIILADKLSWERAAKANGWDAERDPITSEAFMVFAATKRAGHHTLGWEEFLRTVVDVIPGDSEPVDPTPPGA